MYARADASGRFVSSGGKVEIRYKPNDGKRYDAMEKNLAVLEPTVLPDETCGDAERPAPKAAGATGGAANGSKRPGSSKQAAIARGVPEVEDGDLVAYTDGACTGNPGPAGLGVVFVHGKERDELSEYLGIGTNNIAELTAIARALELAEGKHGRLVVHTDSQYAIGVLSKGWKAKANTELVMSIREALAKRPGTRLVYVPGHSGFPLNERADELAQNASRSRHTTRARV
ncbi:MAG TPA: ribonuclease H [Polyangiaceae bacterium]|nr:ribonuclease H [Polyangiaceae bacterium]